MTAEQIKKTAHELGAELCKIADVSRFEGAPKGYHPKDVMSTCKSAIAFAIRIPAATIHSQSTMPYTHAKKM